MASLRRYTARFARWTICCAGAAALFVAGTNAWVHARTRGQAHTSLDGLPENAIAIVPGSPTSRRQVKASLQLRMEGALALYRSGRARAILVSGVDTQSDPETSAMRGWLEQRGVPARDIMADALGTRTRETMNRAMRVFSVERAIVCTEGLHMPRALYLAEHNGIDAVGFATASPLSSHARPVLMEALKTTLAVVEETLAPKPAGRPSRDAVARR